MFKKKATTPETAFNTNDILDRVAENAYARRHSTIGELVVNQLDTTTTHETRPTNIVHEEATPFTENVEYLLDIVYQRFHEHQTRGESYDPFDDDSFVEEEARKHLDGMTGDEQDYAFSLLKEYLTNLEASASDTIQIPRHIGRHATAEVFSVKKDQ